MKKVFTFLIVSIIMTLCFFVTVSCTNYKSILCDDFIFEYNGKSCVVLAKNDYEGAFKYYYSGVVSDYSSEDAPKDPGKYDVKISAEGYKSITVSLEIKTMLVFNEQNEIIGYNGKSDEVVIPYKNNNKEITKIAKLELDRKINLILSPNFTNVAGLKLAEGSTIEVFSDNGLVFDKTCSFSGIEVSINEKCSYITDDFLKMMEGINTITIKSELSNLKTAILLSNMKEIVLKGNAVLTEDISKNDLNYTIIVDENSKSIKIEADQTYLKNMKISSTSEASLHERDFWFCKNLEILTIDGDIVIDNDNGELDNVELSFSENVSKIRGNAFNFINFGKINLSENINSIEAYAFKSNSILKEISLPNSLEIISSGLFAKCSQLEKITLGNNIKEIGAGAFSETNIKNFIMPESVETLGNYIFADSKIESYKDKTNMTYIPENMFSGCSDLKEVELNDNIKVIRNMAFYNCNSITFKIPPKIERIEDYAFFWKSLKSITLPKTLNFIGEFAFSSKTEVINESDSFKKVNNFLLSADGKTILHYYNIKEEMIEIPKGVEDISDGTLYFVDIKNILIHSGLNGLDQKLITYPRIKNIIVAEDMDTLIPLTILADSIEFRSPTPPKLGSNLTFFNDVGKIIVPKDSLEIYKNAFESLENSAAIIAKIVSSK